MSRTSHKGDAGGIPEEPCESVCIGPGEACASGTRLGTLPFGGGDSCLARHTIDHAASAVFWVDHAAQVVYANVTACETLGCPLDELLGRDLADLIDPPDWPAPKTGRQLFERALRTKTGYYVPAELTVVHVESPGQGFFLIYARDITDRKKAEAERERIETQLRQQQKLESIGTLASGVAHEINNPINVVMNYAELILSRTEPGSVVAEFSQEIINESQRIAAIVRNLLAFARQEKEQKRPLKIATVVATTLTLVKEVLRKEQVTLHLEVPDGLPTIRCRAQQIQQVLMNLISNARDALNEKYPEHHPDKIITISAHEISRDGQVFVRTTVEDHGGGIPEEVIDRVFDPFFTSKPRDSGTGLGLSVSHGIVRDHGGDLCVESELGICSRFHMDLPANLCWSASPPGETGAS